MKKIFTFVIAALCGMSAMAEVQTLLSYTVSSNAQLPKGNQPAGEGKDSIYVGTASFTVDSIAAGGPYGWKMDGNLTGEGSTKYVRIDMEEKFAIGDVIHVEGWSGSSASASAPQGFALFSGYDPSKETVTKYADILNTAVAKKTLFDVSYVITEGSLLIGMKRVYIGRQIDKSVFFHAVRVVRGETPDPEPEPVHGDTVKLSADTLFLLKDMTVAPSMTFVAPHITFTLSADTFKLSQDTSIFFSQNGFYTILAGKNNPGPKANLVKPTEGAYYIFQPAKAGHLYVPAKIGANKKIDVSDGTSFMNFAVGNHSFASQTVISADTTTYDFIHFDVQAGKTYYVFGEGTKLGIYGWSFMSSKESALDEVATEVKSVKFFENGKLYIRRGEHVFDAQGRIIR